MSGLKGILASLSIKLSADSAELDRDLEKAKKSTRDWAGETTEAAKNVGAAMGAAAVAAGAALAAMAAKSLENMDQQAEFAQRIGASVEQLTRLQYAAKLNGAEQETLNKGLQQLVKNSSEAAQGLGKSVGAFNELGLSAEKLNQLAPDQQFMLLADAMKGVESANDRTRIAIKLFGDEGASLVNVLMQGQEGLKQLASESDAAGFTVTQSQADIAAAAGDAKDKMSAAFTGVTNQLATHLGPAITKVAEFMATYIPDAVDFVKAGFYGLRLVVSNVFDTITGIIGGIGGTIASMILAPFEQITQGLAYALSVLGADSAASVQAVADKMTAARETAQYYADGFTRIGEAYAENQKTYETAIDAMVQEKTARQEQLDATNTAKLAIEDFTGVNRTKAEVDQAAAAAAREAAQAEKERAAALKEATDLAADQILADAKAAEQAQQARLNGLRGQISGVGALDAAGEDPMAAAESEWVGKQEALIWMLEQEQITRDEYALLREEAERTHQANIQSIQTEAAARQAQFDAMTGAQKTKMVLGQMVQMTAGVANHSRKMFEVNKALALAQAVVALPSAVMQSFENGGGYPWGLIPAGLMLATGLQQINAIKNAKFGGGTTPSLAGSTPTYNNVPVTNGNSQNTGEPGTGGGMKVEIVTTVIGSDPNAVATELNRQLEDKQTVRKIITSVREVSKEEDLSVVDPSSRNAMDIRAA